MARKKPYSKKLMIIDILGALFVLPLWLVIRGPHEYYMHKS